MNLLLARCAVAAVLLTAALAGPAAALSVQGSATFTAEPMQDHRAEIEAAAGRSLRLVASNSKTGLLALFEGTADMAMISAQLGDAAEVLRQNSPGLPPERLRPFLVARVPARLVVHPGNPVRAASLADLRRIPLGEVTNWRELGGPDLPNRVVAAPDGAGVSTTVAAQLIGPGRAITAPGQIRVQQGSQAAAVLEQEPAALGLAQRKLTRGRAVADLATPVPIEQELSLVTLDEPAPAAAAVIEACRAIAERALGH